MVSFLNDLYITFDDKISCFDVYKVSTDDSIDIFLANAGATSCSSRQLITECKCKISLESDTFFYKSRVRKLKESLAS